LRRKVRRWRPEVVAFVGVTLYRVVFGRKSAEPVGPPTPRLRRASPKRRGGGLGLQIEEFESARVFVLPNPSGRNANYSYAEMLAAFRGLRTWLNRPNRSRTRV
jgi:double-stranded uracil-DNA glycosylase